MDSSTKKRASAAVSLVLFTPTVGAVLSGCSQNCDRNFSTPQTSDDCGTGRSGAYRGSTYRSGGGWGFGNSIRSGFGSIGRAFSSGG